MNHLIMLSLWLCVGANPTSSPASADQKPLFPPEMFVLTLTPTYPLEGTAFKPIYLSDMPTSPHPHVGYITVREAATSFSSTYPIPLLRAETGMETTNFGNPFPIPLLPANVAGDFR